MNVIPGELVEETWREVASSSPAQIQKLGNRIGDTQTDLLSFVLVFTQDLGKDARELAVYLFTVIYRIFENEVPGGLQRVKPQKITAAYERNETQFGRLMNAHERFFEKAAEQISLRQPFVMQYLVESLFEPPESEDEKMSLSEEDTGMLFLTFKTVIDVLDDAESRRTNRK